MKTTMIAALAAATLAAGAASAQDATYAITPELEAAARREGKLVYYTSIDVKVAEDLAKAFERRFPGIKVHVERNGAERQFSKIG